jgi:hypothetical protein
LDVDRAEPEDRDDGGVRLVGRYAVVVRGARGALHITARPDRNRIVGLKTIVTFRSSSFELSVAIGIGSVYSGYCASTSPMMLSLGFQIPWRTATGVDDELRVLVTATEI